MCVCVQIFNHGETVETSEVPTHSCVFHDSRGDSCAFRHIPTSHRLPYSSRPLYSHLFQKKGEQCTSYHTRLFNGTLIHQREDGKKLKRRKGREKNKKKPKLRGVTRRAIKELSVFVPQTLGERGRRVPSRSIRNLHLPNLAKTTVCDVVCLSRAAGKEVNQYLHLAFLQIPCTCTHRAAAFIFH